MGARGGREESAAQAQPASRESQCGAGGRCSLAHRELRALDGVLGERERAALRTLDLSHNKLSDAALGALTGCDLLETLILDHNRLQDLALPPLESLNCLTCSGNRLRDLEAVLSVLRGRCPQLRALSLLDNPCCPDFEAQVKHPQRYQTYRLYVVGHLRSLRTLDLQSVTEGEREAAETLLERIAQGGTSLGDELRRTESTARLSRKGSLASASPTRKDSAMLGRSDSAVLPHRQSSRKSSARLSNGGSASHNDDTAPSPPQDLRRRRSSRRRRRRRRDSTEHPDEQSEASPPPRPPPPAADEQQEAGGEAVQGCDPPPGAEAQAGEQGEGGGDEPSPPAAGTEGEEGLPLPQLAQLLRPRGSWGDPPPPPPPPPPDSDEEPEESTVPGRAGAWSDGASSVSSSDAELERVLRTAARRSSGPPPPPPTCPSVLPSNYGPHTPAAPPPPPPHAKKRQQQQQQPALSSASSSRQPPSSWSSDEGPD